MSERWDKLLDGERDDLLPHIEDDLRIGAFAIMDEVISESLGDVCAVELDLASGSLTILDAEFGVTLNAAQVLNLEMFLCQHGKVILPFAFAQVEAGA